MQGDRDLTDVTQFHYLLEPVMVPATALDDYLAFKLMLQHMQLAKQAAETRDPTRLLGQEPDQWIYYLPRLSLRDCCYQET